MRNPKQMGTIMAAVTRTATVILIAGAMTTVASRQTMANSDMAKKTGRPCAKCHTAPPALNDYGKKYKDSLKK
jgi:hypothetical protein